MTEQRRRAIHNQLIRCLREGTLYRIWGKIIDRYFPNESKIIYGRELGYKRKKGRYIRSRNTEL